MTELEYRKLLIDTIRADDYEDKESLLELLKIATLRFEKTKGWRFSAPARPLLPAVRAVSGDENGAFLRLSKVE